jgi:hypothetical protein
LQALDCRKIDPIRGDCPRLDRNRQILSGEFAASPPGFFPFRSVKAGLDQGNTYPIVPVANFAKIHAYPIALVVPVPYDRF